MRKLIHILLFIPLLQSCTEVIDFDINEEQERIVIDGLITNEEKQHFVKVTKSTSFYFDEEPPGVSNAVVSITSEGQDFQLTESPDEPGLYLTDSTVKGEIGKIYTLNVTVDGEVYNAQDTLRALDPIDTTFAFPLIDTLFTLDTSYFILMFAQERPGRGDHYLWNFYINDSLWTPSLRDKSFGNDDFIDGSYPPEGWPVFDGIPYDKVNVGDKVTLEMMSVGGDYFDFIFELFLQTDFRGGFFDGPPANIRTNLSNGALGYFRASAVVRNETYALPLIP